MNLSRIAPAVRRKLWRPARRNNPFIALSHQAENLILLIHIFYSVYFFIVATHFSINWINLENQVIQDPRWPIWWMSSGEKGSVWSLAFLIFCLGTALLAALFPWRLSLRVLCFLGNFLLQAVFASDASGWMRMTSGQVEVLLLFLAIFLPDFRLPRRRDCWQISFVVVLMQMTLFFTYASAGLSRLRWSLGSLLGGQESLLDGRGLANVVAGWHITSGRMGPAGLYIIDHPYLGAPVMLIVTLLEVSSVLVMWRPTLYRKWGFLIMLFHTSTIIVMNLKFLQNFIWVVIFLVCSPFYFRMAQFRKDPAHNV